MYKLIAILVLASLLLRYLQRGNRPAQLGSISAISLAVIGIVTPSIWNWSRQYGTPGLLPSQYLGPSDVSQFYLIFWLISMGALLSGMLFLLFSNRVYSNQRMVSKTELKEVKDSISIPIIGSLTVLLLVFGMGKSLLFNDAYLDFSGSQTLLRAANAILPASIVALGFACFDSKYRKLNASFLVCIFLIQATRGSRIIFSLLIMRSKSIPRIFTYLMAMIFSFQLLVSLTFSARNTSSGLTKFPTLIADAFVSTSQVESYVPSLGKMMASLSSWAPTVIASIPESSSKVIIRNLNPLIGTGTDSMAYSSDGIERLFPYVWIPLSSLGQIYGAFGSLTLLLVVFLISTVASLSLIPLRRSNSLSVYSLLAVATYIFQFPLFFQYSSRIWIRVLWLMALMSVLHFSHLIRFRNRRIHHYERE